jgi:tetrapyrrole methylase family protein/MazG family protein
MVKFLQKEAYSVADFVELIEVLRAPDGCPWDREQTHASVRRNLLEEAYEAAEAIDELCETGDSQHLKEELGDVLMQVIFHAQIEREQGGFDLGDIADYAVKKLIYRHPHVFGDINVSGSEEVLNNWDKLKQAERSEETVADTLKNVSRNLPALWRAEKLYSKAVKSDAAAETLTELFDGQLTAITEDELGELLFKLAARGKISGIDPEAALNNACERFIAKFI